MYICPFMLACWQTKKCHGTSQRKTWHLYLLGRRLGISVDRDVVVCDDQQHGGDTQRVGDQRQLVVGNHGGSFTELLSRTSFSLMEL